MSKPVKELIGKELARRFAGLRSLAVADFTGVDAVTTNRLRARLREKDIRVTVVKNSLARRAFKQVGLEAAAGLLDGPCAVAYGSDSVVTVVRELLALTAEAPHLTVKAALLEGEVFGPERIEELSRFPTREEAIGRLIQSVLSAGGRLVGCLIGPGAKVASLVKAIQERQEPGDSQAA